MFFSRGGRPQRAHTTRAAVLAVSLSFGAPALALDKQGSAHGGDVEVPTSGFDLTGSAAIGISPYNPSYAARPDNTGRALMRYALHGDLDLIGHRLSIPLDLNVFSDRERPGLLKLAPSEVDVIGGITSTWSAGPGAIEFGLRGESDRPVDQGTLVQSYIDFRTRYLFSLGSCFPGLDRALGGGDITGWGTYGVFVINHTYAARPDNSGLALFRYALHLDTAFWNSHAAVALDATMFTDRETNAIRPSELDFTPELIARFNPFEVHLAYERDMTVDGKGTNPAFVQSFVYLLGVWSFDFRPR